MMKSEIEFSPDKFGINRQRRGRKAATGRGGMTLMDFDEESDRDSDSDESDEEGCGVVSRNQMKKLSSTVVKNNFSPLVVNKKKRQQYDSSLSNGGVGDASDDKVQAPSSAGKNRSDRTNNDKAGMQLGFDLRGSLANIESWVDSDSDSDCGDTNDGTCVSSEDKKKTVNIKPASHSMMIPTALTREALQIQCQAVINSPDSSNDSSEDAEVKGITFERGAANTMTDKELISMLKMQPKDVPEMKTRDSFRRFFARMKKDRFEYLLRAANSTRSIKESDKKVQKRLHLMKDVLL